MTWTRRLAVCATLMVAVVVGGASQAHAASQNIGWLYSVGGQAKGFFNADYDGAPGEEAIKACDVDTDDHSAFVALYDGSTLIAEVVDSQNDGNCTRKQYNMIPDGRYVTLEVCDSEHLFDDVYNIWDCRYGYGFS